MYKSRCKGSSFLRIWQIFHFILSLVALAVQHFTPRCPKQAILFAKRATKVTFINKKVHLVTKSSPPGGPRAATDMKDKTENPWGGKPRAELRFLYNGFPRNRISCSGMTPAERQKATIRQPGKGLALTETAQESVLFGAKARQKGRKAQGKTCPFGARKGTSWHAKGHKTRHGKARPTVKPTAKGRSARRVGTGHGTRDVAAPADGGSHEAPKVRGFGNPAHRHRPRAYT